MSIRSGFDESCVGFLFPLEAGIGTPTYEDRLQEAPFQVNGL